MAPGTAPRTAPRTWREHVRDLLSLHAFTLAAIGVASTLGFQATTVGARLERLTLAVDSMRRESQSDRAAIGVLLRIQCAATPDAAEQLRLQLPCAALQAQGYGWRGISRAPTPPDPAPPVRLPDPAALPPDRRATRLLALFVRPSPPTSR